jgi:ABC-2 type transport system ATP-binding protein
VSPAETVLELADAHLSFEDVRALDGMTLAVRAGEVFGLVGPDGAGKTTAIRALLGLLPLDAGTARTLGRDPVREGAQVRPHVGYLSQRFTLYGDLTVQENVDFFGRIHEVPDLRAQREQVLEFSRLAPYRSRRADALSGGMQKKLALACTLVHTPRAILLDEPTTGVDPISRRELWELLSQLVGRGISVLVTTPYLDEAERCTRVALVRAGKVMATDTPAALRGSLGRKLVEVVCRPVRSARDQLARSERVEEVQLFGDRVHALPRRAGDDLRDVVARLEGVQVDVVREVLPSLEDVYIRQVEHGT